MPSTYDYIMRLGSPLYVQAWPFLQTSVFKMWGLQVGIPALLAFRVADHTLGLVHDSKNGQSFSVFEWMPGLVWMVDCVAFWRSGYHVCHLVRHQSPGDVQASNLITLAFKLGFLLQGSSWEVLCFSCPGWTTSCGSKTCLARQASCTQEANRIQTEWERRQCVHGQWKPQRRC